MGFNSGFKGLITYL